MSWEERMAERARHRDPVALARWLYGTEFPHFGPDPPDGMIGKKYEQDRCSECWEDHYRWSVRSNGWFVWHRPPGLEGCQHSCHADEVWLAS